jgi:hypothetical protein
VHLATNVYDRTLCGALVQPLSLAVDESCLVSAAGLAISNAETRDVGERGRNRTFNLLIKSQLLCQLSYAPGKAVRANKLPRRHKACVRCLKKSVQNEAPTRNAE